ncbi:MAG: rRNA (cytosine967-C5)-methyltransferase [Blastocatellia bacterium]|jgi:16S rRNA (cytosine967-C5)-methyltransferase|nr:rRNA (cytosine967-C5)-methyltransferase [Blastocatellia bacterium]
MSARRKPNGQSARRRNTTPVSAARSAAFNILRRVEEAAAYASVLLAATDEEMRADDRSLCYELTLGCLRWQLWLDALIERYAGRSAASLDAPVRHALRLGLYQLRFLTRIPASAVVNESVNLTYAARVRSAAGFVNAVLRRAVREPDFDPAAHITEPLARLSIESSHPLWLIERWANAFGFEETRAFAHANNEAPPVAFRLNNLVRDQADVLEKLTRAGAILTPSELAPEAWRIEGASGALRELARQGAVYIQDEASQLVAHVLDARSHERVLDACAAPGSKTTHIAARTTDLRLLVAGDIHLHRLQLVREAGARLSIGQVSLVEHDATARLPFAERAFERVLVDAPCTGTGTLRRNPEIRWRISTADVAELAGRQRRILLNAAQTVASGGRLVYSTCSVEPEENESVVAAFLHESEEFRPLKLETPARLLNEQGTTARTWPQRDGADGFFIAAFERRS